MAALPRTTSAARHMVDEDQPALVPPAAPVHRSQVGDRDAAQLGSTKRRRTTAAAASSTGHTSGQAPPTPPSSASRRRPASTLAANSTSSSTRSPSSPKLLVKLDGRVYRPPSPGDPRTKLEFEADLLLGGPTETVEDLEVARRERRRREVEDEMKREAALASPRARRPPTTTGASRLLTFDSDDERDTLKVVGPSRTPTRARPHDHRRAVTPPPRPAFPLGPASPTPSSSATATLGYPFALHTSPRRAGAGPQSPPLPPPLAALLALHNAVERALILHLSTSGSGASLASTLSDLDPDSGSGSGTGSGTAHVRMPNLVDLSTLGRMLESNGRRCGEDELRRLVWAWQGANDDPASPPRRANNGGGLGGGLGDDEVGGMGFIVSRARTAVVAAPGRVAYTYGLGISVAVRSNPQLPKFELVSPGRPGHAAAAAAAAAAAPPSPSSVGKGREGMSIVALWTQGKEARRVELEGRLRRWSERSRAGGVKREEDELTVDDDDLHFTASTSSTTAGIPLAALPLLAPAVSAIPSTSTPSPTKRAGAAAPRSFLEGGGGGGGSSAADLPVASPREFVGALLKGKPVRTKAGTAADRAAARRERIEAKQRAQQQSAYHGSFSALASGESSPSKRSLKRHADDSASTSTLDDDATVPLTAFEQHKRNAMLSRLGSVADVVAMRCAGRPTPLEEVCTAVANSPLLNIGFDEASQAVSFLASHFPNFVYLKLVGQERWVYLRGVQKAVEVKERVRDELARAQEAMRA
ncbi:uncharacterized protein RHOBADRAFT_53680 [Rhodotorula graminis WP1]|uniref:Uncharacterized protein n=1 Tax=Rhodotorula graminis (strain WP1) TaxID=578459 RepID=A0A194S5N4_RHOGW|nr:uncharacterized protein RHOBADRAFT_53680 [Rhodotorula graminis WP1]KPV74731.1 hypothetical protein RHOBADRAFT_53680 [Rhodotorula graminis WP1]